MAASHAETAPVLLFDGGCGLCNAAVGFLLRIDRRGILRFATLQGAPGQAWLRANGLPEEDFESMVLVRDWDGAAGYALRTDALVGALRACGGLGRALAWIRVIPRPWRDGAYRVVARLRYRVFGEWRPAPLASPQWAARFVDGSRS